MKDDSKRVVILNSKNSSIIKDTIKEVSKEVMKKNKELYRRLSSIEENIDNESL